MTQNFVDDMHLARAEAYAANDEREHVTLLNEALALRQRAIRDGQHPNQLAAQYYVAAAREIAHQALESGDYQKLNLLEQCPNMPYCGPSGYGAPHYTRSENQKVAREMYIVRMVEMDDDVLTAEVSDSIMQREPITPARRKERMDQAAAEAAQSYKHMVNIASMILNADDASLALDRGDYPGRYDSSFEQ